MTGEDMSIRENIKMVAAAEAVAWTFGIEAGKFDMVAQT